MTSKERVEKIKAYVTKEMVCPGHNIDHVMRVYNICLHLAQGEKIDREVLQTATLLHDIGGARELEDKSGKTDHAVESSKMAEPILRELGFSEDKIDHIKDCIISHRYKNNHEPKTLEAKLLFDADKLDALGAIGVARSFVWVGKNNANIYKKVENLEKYAKENLSGKIGGRIQDKSKHSPQIEFETKLKYLADKMHTAKAKKIAKERLKLYKDFLKRLEKEVQGKL
ncbi:MAG: HD domain-containing protein [Candidatus Moranbacteria bacterium]|nr:HD domain-containing protein [Candidatus Moranbacteria bacterium]